MKRNPFTDDERDELAAAGLTPRDVGDAARGDRVDIPASVDAAVLAIARSRARLATTRRRNPLRILYAALPLAAALLLAVGLFTGSPREARPAADASREVAASAVAQPATPPAVRARASMDLDESGSVDIADAFLMSRRLRRDAPPPAAWDFDGDGAVNRADVEALAAAAVSL